MSVVDVDKSETERVTYVVVSLANLMLRAMHYKEFKQRIRRKLGMKKHRILREHASILERNSHPSNRRSEKTQARREVRDDIHGNIHEDGSTQQNNQPQKVLYHFNIHLLDNI